jgi:hypothetical protein
VILRRGVCAYRNWQERTIAASPSGWELEADAVDRRSGHRATSPTIGGQNMSVQAADRERMDYGAETSGDGWVAFAGVLVLILGTMNTIEGIAAIGNANFFVHGTHYVFASLKTWGWITLILGICQLLVGFGIFARNQFARWVGVFILSLNALAQLLMIPAYPFWSLSIFAIDILAIYGLVAYGQRIATARY